MKLFASKKFDDSAFLNSNAFPLKPLSGMESEERRNKSIAKAVARLIPQVGTIKVESDHVPDPISQTFFSVRESYVKIHLISTHQLFAGSDYFVVQWENTNISLIPQAHVASYKSAIIGVALFTETLGEESLAFRVLKAALDKLDGIVDEGIPMKEFSLEKIEEAL